MNTQNRRVKRKKEREANQREGHLGGLRSQKNHLIQESGDGRVMGR